MKESIRMKESVNDGIWEESKNEIGSDMKKGFYRREISE